MAAKLHLTLGLALALAPLSVFATLGGDVSSVSTDQTELHAGAQQLIALPHQAASLVAGAPEANTQLPSGVSVQQLTQADGATIREYIADGKVFGIAWNAPTPPNLHQLLGNYFPSYVTAVQTAAAHGAKHGPQIIQANGLVVYTGGHMNAFMGEAFMPQQLPPNFSAKDIQ